MNDHSFAKLVCKSTTPKTFREFFSSYITRINPIARGIINYYCQVWSGYARHRGSLLRIFVAAMIQDIHPHRFDNRYHARKRPGRLDFILHYRENSVLLKNAGDRLEIPRMDDLPALEDQAETVFLFTFDDVSCFLLQEDPGAFGSQLAYRELGFFRTTRQQEIAWICLVGYHLANWYGQHRFCGKCGAPMTPGTGERAIACSGLSGYRPGCDRGYHLPRQDPAGAGFELSRELVFADRGVCGCRGIIRGGPCARGEGGGGS